MLCNIAFTSKNTLRFPGIFRRKFFQEFSEFRKFLQNVPESFFNVPLFFIIKKIDFRPVARDLYQKICHAFSGKFSEFPEFLNSGKFSEKLL